MAISIPMVSATDSAQKGVVENKSSKSVLVGEHHSDGASFNEHHHASFNELHHVSPPDRDDGSVILHQGAAFFLDLQCLSPAVQDVVLLKVKKEALKQIHGASDAAIKWGDCSETDEERDSSDGYFSDHPELASSDLNGSCSDLKPSSSLVRVLNMAESDVEGRADRVGLKVNDNAIGPDLTANRAWRTD